MKITSSKVLNAALGSALILAALTTVSLMALTSDRRERRADARTVERPIVDVASRFSESDPRPVERERSGETSELRKAQADLLRKVELLESRLAESEAREPTRDDVVPIAEENEEDADIDESPEAQDERMMAQIRAQVSNLETTLQTELVDKDWARPAADALRQAFEAEAAEGVELLEADCRSSMCRLTLAFDPARAEETFRNLQRMIPWEGEAFFQIEDLDSGEAILYIAREEYPLPRVTE